MVISNAQYLSVNIYAMFNFDNNSHIDKYLVFKYKPTSTFVITLFSIHTHNI